MKFDFLRNGFAALLFVLCLSAFGAAQEERRNVSGDNQSVYVISAKAGGVNYVSGVVRVERAATGTRQILAKSDEIRNRDSIITDGSGKAEILLNPGSFLRLAENTELEFVDTDIEALKLKLTAGSALIEANAVGEKGADISLATPLSKIKLEKSGIYRVNVSPLETEILIWKGAATVGGEIVKGGRKIVVNKNGTAAVAKFEKDGERDALDIWSKDRAKELAKLNEKLERRSLTRAFNGFSTADRTLHGFSAEFSRPFGGFWLLNRFTGAYCYVPFGWSVWESPYGYGYNRGIFWGYGYRPVVIAPSNPPIMTKSDDAPGFTGAPIPTTKGSSAPPAAAPPIVFPDQTPKRGGN